METRRAAVSRWQESFFRLVHPLSAPHPSVTDARLYRRLQALAIFSFMNVALALAVLLPSVTADTDIAIPALLFASMSLYLLARSRWYHVAIWQLTATTLLAPLLFLPFGRVDALFQVIVIYLMTSVFVQKRTPLLWLYALGSATLIAVSMLAFPIQQAITPTTLAINALHILATFALVVMVQQGDLRQLRDLVKQTKHAAAYQQAIIDSLPGVVYTVTPDYRMTNTHGSDSHPMMEKTQAMVGKRLDEALPPHIWQVVRPHIDQVLSQRQAVQYETELPRANQPSQWVENRLAPLMYDQQVAGVLTLMLDIADRKRAEKASYANAHLLQAVLDAIMVGVFIQQDDRIVFHNQMVNALTGFDSQELQQQSLHTLIAPELRDLARSWVPDSGRVMQLSQSEIPIQDRSNRRLWVNLTLSSIDYGGRPAVLVAFVNATRNVEMQQSILQRERQFRLLIENSSDIIVMLYEDLSVKYISPAVEHILGYQQEEWVGAHMLDAIPGLYHPEEEAHVREQIGSLIKEPLQPIEVRLRMKHAQGRWVWIEMVGSNMLREPGVEAIILNAHDITTIQNALRAEREQRTLSEALLDTAAALNSTLQLEEVLPYILENLHQILPYEKANVALVEDNGSTRVVTHRGYSPAHTRSILSSALHIEQSSPYRRMIHTREVVYIPDTAALPDWLVLPGEDTRCYLGAPITLDDEVIGFLNLESHKLDAFAEHDSLRLRQFANHAALAIRNARAYEQGRAFAAAQERQRIASDLHDAVSQTLFSASMISETLPLLYEHDPQEVHAGLHELARLTKGALAEMRALLMELRPEAFARTDLRTLLTHLINGARTRTDAVIHPEMHAEGDRLPPNVRLNLYRITQEALNNIIRHAQASEVWVTLQMDADGTALTIRDNGRGFVVEGISSEHMGLRIMRERAQNHDIDLHIETTVGQGTVVHAEFSTVRPPRTTPESQVPATPRERDS